LITKLKEERKSRKKIKEKEGKSIKTKIFHQNFKMIFSRVFPFLCLVAGTSAQPKECQFKCAQDSDCSPGLHCADGREKELESQGFHKRWAYCTAAQYPYLAAKKDVKEEVCYDPKKLIPKNKPDPKTLVYPPPSPLIGECKSDCDFDTDCLPGLLCADEHSDELRKQGLDPRFGTCKTQPGLRKDFEVCYKPKERGGFGGTFNQNQLPFTKVLACLLFQSLFILPF
jgi:hypothetical protein